MSGFDVAQFGSLVIAAALMFGLWRENKGLRREIEIMWDLRDYYRDLAIENAVETADCRDEIRRLKALAGESDEHMGG